MFLGRPAVLLLLAWFCVGQRALAQQCPNMEGASANLGRQDASARIEFIRHRMPTARRRAKRWFLGWTLSFTALTAGQLALIPLQDDPESKRTLLVNSGSTALGAAFLAFAPPKVIRHEKRLEAELAAKTDDRCAVLAVAEQLLLSEAEAEQFGQSWLMHGGNVLLNLGAGLLLGLGWDSWQSAWLTTAVGTLVGEVMIWTQPMDATRDLERYRTGKWIGQTARRPTLHVHPVYVRAGGGVGLSGLF
ncbi:MAG: hypothetical protein JRJ84_15305 [Deltaproteobacteria bacterium]|nr:hypothetical protein [Deltaproteobacteria bacterium]